MCVCITREQIYLVLSKLGPLISAHKRPFIQNATPIMKCLFLQTKNPLHNPLLTPLSAKFDKKFILRDSGAFFLSKAALFLEKEKVVSKLNEKRNFLFGLLRPLFLPDSTTKLHHTLPSLAKMNAFPPSPTLSTRTRKARVGATKLVQVQVDMNKR